MNEDELDDYPRPPFVDGRFVGHDHASLELLEARWRVVCECTETGEADAPAIGPDPASCALCGEVVRAEWSPTIHNTKENPTMHLHPTNGSSSSRSDDEKVSTSSRILGAGLAGLGCLVAGLLLVLVALVLVWGIVAVLEAIR